MKKIYRKPEMKVEVLMTEDILLLSAESQSKDDSSLGVWNLYPDMFPGNGV